MDEHAIPASQLLRMDSLDSDNSVSPDMSPSGSVENTEVDLIYKEAYEMAVDVIQRAQGLPRPTKTTKLVAGMRNLIDKLTARHEILYDGMVRRLNENERNNSDAGVVLRAVGDEMFSDNRINWGRIVALYAFVAKWSAYNEQEEKSSQLNMNQLPQLLAMYISRRLGHWIIRNGGWDGLLKTFPQENDWESKVLTGLVVTGVGLGIVASFYAFK